jgi:hypothetical protein
VVDLRPNTRVALGSIRLFFGEMFARIVDVATHGGGQVTTDGGGRVGRGTRYAVRRVAGSGATAQAAGRSSYATAVRCAPGDRRGRRWWSVRAPSSVEGRSTARPSRPIDAARDAMGGGGGTQAAETRGPAPGPAFSSPGSPPSYTPASAAQVGWRPPGWAVREVTAHPWRSYRRVTHGSPRTATPSAPSPRSWRANEGEVGRPTGGLAAANARGAWRRGRARGPAAPRLSSRSATRGDELTRVFSAPLDGDIYSRVARWTVGELREHLLADAPQRWLPSVRACCPRWQQPSRS